ncbi:MAG: hypothetical protein KKH52_04045 [Nanoarchaeota archaeon]|nr:hypothetical protein [Nanoarchaeota archaeon]
MMEEIKRILQKLTKHDYVKVVFRGNAAIDAAVAIVKKKILIPEEGGWLHYQKVGHDTVKCNQAKIDLVDLEEKLQTGKFGAFLYHQPGGYFAEQPIRRIYQLCQKYNCLIIMDVSGSIGTSFCDGNYADVLVGSFGKWKLVEARVGGFISCRDHNIFKNLVVNELKDEGKLNVILECLNGLKERIKFLLSRRKKIIEDLCEFEIVRANELGFVVVVKYGSEQEKEKILKYCQNNQLEYTECPRYIRLNEPAISIEVKRLIET